MAATTKDLSSILAQLGGELLQGDAQGVVVQGVTTPEKSAPGKIVVLQKRSLWQSIDKKQVAAIVVAEKREWGESPAPLIYVPDAKLAQIELLKLFDPRREKIGQGIDARALVDENARLGAGVTIMAGAVVMAGAVLEDYVVVYPNATVEYDAHVGEGSVLYPSSVVGERCILGRYNILYGGAIIGSDGYGYYDKEDERYKIPQIGIVRTEEYVEIGANVCIDRATVDETLIQAYTKFDNLVQVGHNVQIGYRCLVVAQAGIAGSSSLGKEVILGGQAAVSDHVHIGDGVIALAQSGIPNDVAPKERVFGTPARPVRESHRINGALAKLPQLLQRVADLEKKVSES